MVSSELVEPKKSGLGGLLPEMRTALPGPRAELFVEKLVATECPALTARRAARSEKSGADHDPLVWEHAQGSNVVDADGNRFVDLTASFGVMALGHCDRQLVEALQEQAGRLTQALGDLHPSTTKLDLMERLVALSPMPKGRVILGLNGSDAIAAALKTATLATGKTGIMAFEGGYHGLMYGPLSVCGYKEGFRAPFRAQLNPDVAFAPYPDERPESVRQSLAAVDRLWTEEIGAILVEPALARGGVVFPGRGFLDGLCERAAERGALVIVDEIFTGLGRTGRLWAHLEGFEGQVDILCAGKALGGGLPLSACIGRAEVMEAWGDPGGEAIHTATFAGNPLACATGLACLEAIEARGLVERSRTLGARLKERLGRLAGDHEEILEIRGKGLMLGIALNDSRLCFRLIRRLLEVGYLTLPAGDQGRIIALNPALNIEWSQLEGVCQALDTCLRAELS